MGEPGIKVVQQALPMLKATHKIDLVIAQAENVTEGKGLSKSDFMLLKHAGIDFCTGGNWTGFRTEIHDYLNDPQQPVIRPANYPDGTPGKGWKYAQSKKGPVLIISLLGQIVGKDSANPMDNPLHIVDQILEENKTIERAATIVNFHGDYSSEKRVVGYYLDGRVTAVVGDHWHVSTADAMILPKGTAHITDVGMCGSLHSSLGVKLDIIISRWKDGIKSKNELETTGPLQFNAVLIESNSETKLAKSIQSINLVVNSSSS